MENENKKSPMSTMERFEAENERILRDSQLVEKEAREKVREYEKKLSAAKSKREKTADQFERLRADYERLEVETLEKENRRIKAAAVKKEDVLNGAVSAEEYLRSGQSLEEITVVARAETAKKLGTLLEAVRGKGLEVLKLEVEEAECGRELLFLNTYPASFMLERMRAQVKSLESHLCAGAGSGGAWGGLEEKRAALNRATGKMTTGQMWNDLDLAAVKRLRFDAGIPDSELPALNEIIAEMESCPGSRVQLRFTSISPDGKHGLSVGVWR